MRIAIFGGSFNPPHIGHYEAAQAALSQLGADKMIIIPAATAPLKQQAEDSPDAEARLKMARLAFGKLENTEISDLEVCRGGISYTVDTLREIKKQYPDDEMFLLMGTDQIDNFDKWKDYREIVKLCTIAPFPRRPGDMGMVLAAADFMRKNYSAKVEIVDFTPTDISSTQLRELLPKRQGRQYFPDEVYSEIIKNRYYTAQPEYAWLREKSYSYLDPKRVAHVEGCEQEAVRLAKRWGGDEQLAAEAGILHDITKKLKGPEQLKLCEQYDIMTDTDEKANYKLLHSKTGAAFSRDLFGICDEVYSAIFWHTTAKPDMTLLEKIIYMADYIEPNRDFEGVQKLREKAYENLDEALILGLEMSMEDLKLHGTKPHKNSIEAMNWLIEHR